MPATTSRSSLSWTTVALGLTRSLPIVVFALGCGAGEPVATREALLSVNGTELFVTRLGRGEPVVVVHGGPLLEHGYLLPHLSPLADHYELILYDQRLSGRSASTVDSASVRLATFVEDIEALRAALGLGRIHLVGHSWGGLLALRYAIEHGDHLRSLVLLDAMAPSSELWQQEESEVRKRSTPEDSADAAALRATPAFANREPAAVAEALHISFRGQFADRTKIDGLTLHVPADYRERSRQLGFMMPDLLAFDFTDELKAIRVPTLILYGDAEPSASIAGATLRNGIPNAELVIVPDAGHFPFIEQPGATLAMMAAFLDRVSAPSSR
ncbi:MAG TPA: alpha/beta fold hydrolase [Gemmatimonadales bacterium]|jgi:proline iminopeptidase